MPLPSSGLMRTSRTPVARNLPSPFARSTAAWWPRGWLVALRELAAAFIRTYAVLVPTTCVMVGSSFLKRTWSIVGRSTSTLEDISTPLGDFRCLHQGLRSCSCSLRRSLPSPFVMVDSRLVATWSARLVAHHEHFCCLRQDLRILVVSPNSLHFWPYALSSTTNLHLERQHSLAWLLVPASLLFRTYASASWAPWSDHRPHTAARSLFPRAHAHSLYVAEHLLRRIP